MTRSRQRHFPLATMSCAALTLILFTAFQKTSAQTLVGVGEIYCSEWLQLRSEVPGSGLRARAEAWIDGFLSGSNVEDTARDFLKVNQNTAIFYEWIDSYCKKEASNRIVDAAEALVDEIQVQHPAPLKRR